MHLSHGRRETGLGHRVLNSTWVGDITYLRSWEGWLCLATGDACSGSAIADHMRTDLVEDA